MHAAHRKGGNRKCSQQSTNADQKSLEKMFSIVICRHDFYLRPALDCHLSSVDSECSGYTACIHMLA